MEICGRGGRMLGGAGRTKEWNDKGRQKWRDTLDKESPIQAGWDGLGQPPAEGTPSPGPKRRVSSRAQDQSERLKPEYDLSKASGEASIGFPSDDDELKRRLVIC